MANISFFEEMYNRSGMTDKNGEKFIVFDQATFFSKNPDMRPSSGSYIDANIIINTFLDGTSYICKKLCTRTGIAKYALNNPREFDDLSVASWEHVKDILSTHPAAKTMYKTSLYFLYMNPDYGEPKFDFSSAFECLKQCLIDYVTDRSKLTDGTISIINEAFTYLTYDRNPGELILKAEFEEDITNNTSRYKYKEKASLDKHQQDLYNDMKEAVENEDFNTVYKLINFSFHLIDLGKTLDQKRKEYIRE